MRNTPTRSQAAVLVPTSRRLHQYICLALLLIGIAILAAQKAVANTPTIRLFPTTVVEDLRQTGNVARDMETGLQAPCPPDRCDLSRDVDDHGGAPA